MNEFYEEKKGKNIHELNNNTSNMLNPSYTSTEKKKNLKKELINCILINCCCIICMIIFTIFISILSIFISYLRSYNGRECMKNILNDNIDISNVDYSLFNYTLEFGTNETIYNVQMKGTHNSYHQKTKSIGKYINDWKYSHESLKEQLDMGGRNFELDVHYSIKRNRWTVFHLIVDHYSSCKCLSDCLMKIKDWSVKKNKKHHPIVVLIEPKPLYDVRKWCKIGDTHIFDQLWIEILSIFDYNDVLIPAKVQGNYSSIQEALVRRGWPSLTSTEGKIMFVFNIWRENLKCRDVYKNVDLKLAFLLIDYDENVNDYSFTNPINNMKIIHKKKLMTRLYSNTKDNLLRNIEKGVNIFSTDYLTYTDLYLKNGSICNKVVTSNSECNNIQNYLNGLN